MCYLLGSASLFNETDVSLDIGSTGDDMHVSVKVKIPGGMYIRYKLDPTIFPPTQHIDDVSRSMST